MNLEACIWKACIWSCAPLSAGFVSVLGDRQRWRRDSNSRVPKHIRS